MRKRMIFALLLALTLLAGCCLNHSWEEATCETAKTCAQCGKTEGEALGHSFADATCREPARCTVCGDTKGTPLGHSWEPATCVSPRTCSQCHETEGDLAEHQVKEWIFRTDQETGSCTVCGAELQREPDWEALAPRVMEGSWEGFLATIGTESAELEEDMLALEFTADGKAAIYLQGEKNEGTWTYVSHEPDGDTSCMYFTADLDGETFSLVVFDNDLNYLYMVKDQIVLVFFKP